MRKILIAGVAASVALLSGASAQGPGASIDATNAAQDDAIAALIVKNTAQDGELADRADIDRVIGIEIIEIKKRIDALEKKPPPPDPDPVPDPDPTPDPTPDPDPTPTPDPVPPPSPSHSPQTLIGFSQSTHWTHEDAFINHVFVAGPKQHYPAAVAGGHIDESAGKIVSVPSGGLTIGYVRAGSDQAPDHYAGRWTGDWQGDCDVTLQSGSVGDITRAGQNRFEELYEPARHGVKPPALIVTRVGPAGCWGLRFYRSAHAALIDAGNILDPSFRDLAARFDIDRPMDWTGVNGAAENKVSDRAPANRLVWFDGRVPDWALIRASIETGNQLWLNTPAHLGLSDATFAMLKSRSGTQDQRVAAVAAEYQSILASGEHLAYARAIVAELNRQGWPLDRPLYIEVGNESWNSTFIVGGEFFWGVGKALGRSGGDIPNGYGVITAKMATAFAQAFAEGGRGAQVWTMAVGTQTANVGRTTAALGAIKQLTTEPMARYGVATTNYYKGAFGWTPDNLLFGSRLTQAAWESRWLADLASDPAGLRKRITDYMLDPTPKPQNAAWVLARLREHKAAAESAGARAIGSYEGDSHNVMSKALQANAAARALFHEWHESDDHGRVITMIADGMRAIDPTLIIANYKFCAGGRAPESPWIECAPWDQSGGDNAAWSVLLQ